MGTQYHTHCVWIQVVQIRLASVFSCTINKLTVFFREANSTVPSVVEHCWRVFVNGRPRPETQQLRRNVSARCRNQRAFCSSHVNFFFSTDEFRSTVRSVLAIRYCNQTLVAQANRLDLNSLSVASGTLATSSTAVLNFS